MHETSDRRPTGRISVIDPLSQAIVWSRDVLFRPFDLGKWLLLGFCAWLAGLGERGGGPNLNFHQGGGHRDLEHGLHEAWEWVVANLALIVFVVTVIVFVAITLWLLFLWLSSRGKFMFLDGVVHDRAEVVAPWHRFRAPANALFRFRIVVGLLCGVIVLLFLTSLGLLLWLGIEARAAEPFMVLTLVCALVPFVLAMIAFGLVALAVNDFVVPLMYLHDGGVAAAWRELGRLFSARPGAFVLYVLVKILIAVAVVVISVFVCCLTCCIVILPYVGTVILLPIAVFLRAYPLYFLGQFGPPYARFATLGPEAVPSEGRPA
jgi:hypothetical protein